MKRILLLALLAATGCRYLEGQGPFGIPIAGDGFDGPVIKVDRQDDAEMIVWKWTLGSSATIVSPPPVVWITGSTCTSNDGHVLENSFECNGAKSGCCNGYFSWQSYVVYVSWRGEHISDTSYSHEMCHAWMWTEGLEIDSDHSSNCYQGGSGVYQGPDTLVGESNRRLKVVGL